MITNEDLERRFTYHPPRPEVGDTDVYAVIRSEAAQFARAICALTPDCREQSLAITALEEVVYWANAARARNGKGAPR